MVVIVMGVSGSGKSTVGAAAAARLGWKFVEGDAFHTAGNIAKMSRGEALTDVDRGPWLATLGREIAGRSAAGESVVVACSALKRAYRDGLRCAGGDGVVFVHLVAPPEVIRGRMALREHFMGAGMLESQFAALERPGEDEEGVIEVPAVGDVEGVVRDVVAWVASKVGEAS